MPFQVLKFPAVALAAVAAVGLGSATPSYGQYATPHGAWSHVESDPAPQPPVLQVPTVAERAKQAAAPVVPAAKSPAQAVSTTSPAAAPSVASRVPSAEELSRTPVIKLSTIADVPVAPAPAAAAPLKSAPGVPVTSIPVAHVVAVPEAVAPEPVTSTPVAAQPRIVPKIIDVPGADEQSPSHHTADRDQLLREFPDSYVEAMWLQDWTDLERAHQFGRLVDVVSDPEGRGIELRLEGGSRIGELETDPYRQMLLCRLAKPAAGLLYRIAARMRQAEGEEFEPLEITSLVRTWDYQLRLTDVNPNADRTREGVPPTHVLGLAFDIARTSMSKDRQHRLELLLDQMAIGGELAYYKEGSTNGLMHYHVIALPSADAVLVRAYERESPLAQREEVVAPSKRYLPDAPCVEFGSSLEPFSAICSCELPLEVSASAWLANAPVSR